MLQKEKGGDITGYATEIKIHCTLCGQPFKFVGVPAGGDPLLSPTANAEFTELKVPLIASTGPLIKDSTTIVN
ncbi:MAG: hypothetical protein IT212_07450 [Bacteroidia bacterium]|nr:hypothetical protein [Bacteroidia bacterium]